MFLTIQGIVSKFHFLQEQQQLTMHLKYAEILVIVLHQNMKIGDNTRNNERLSQRRYFDKVIIVNFLYCSPYVIPLQVIKNIETQRSCKMTVKLDNLKFLKTFIMRFQNYLFIW